jgi:hypothetical protein
MKISTSVIPFVFSLLPSLIRATVVSYDAAYDNQNTSLNSVACSDGSNGMQTRGYTTYGSLPKFPYIGGFVGIAGWNSPNCGSCHQLTYTNTTSGVTRKIHVLAIDRTESGYNIALEAMDALTGGQGKALGRVNVAEASVSPSVCGL